MKRLIALVMVIVCFSATVGASASTNTEKKTFDDYDNTFIQELSRKEIKNRDDFEKAVKRTALSYGRNLEIESVSEKVEVKNDYEEEFCYSIDYDNKLVIAETKRTKQVPKAGAAKAPRATTYITTASAEKEVYSWAGIHIYTVSTDGQFEWQSGRYCNVISSHGYFNPAFLSLWEASVWVNTGNYSSTYAYVNTYGTANLNLGIAQVLGITVNIQSFNYSQVLTCDSYGNVSASYSES